jgi:hypothetical protein
LGRQPERPPQAASRLPQLEAPGRSNLHSKCLVGAVFTSTIIKFPPKNDAFPFFPPYIERCSTDR